MLKRSKLLMLILSTSFIFFSCSKKDYEVNDKGLNLTNIDSTVSPAKDFYDFAIGNWRKKNNIPDEYSRWGSFEILSEENYKVLHSILDSAAKNKDASPGSNLYKVGMFYSLGMDTAKIEKQGYSKIKGELDKVDAVANKDDLYKEIAHLHQYFGAPFFSFGSTADEKNSEMTITGLSQGGLGLPDKDYYLMNDDRSKEVRSKYHQHIINIFKLINYKEAEAKKAADKILNIETKLAKASRSRVELRVPDKNYNKMNLSGLEKIAPQFDWHQFFKLVDLTNPGDIDVGQPEFFTAVGQVVSNTPIEDLKAYLKWNILRGLAPYLSSDFVNERFDFYEKFLNGSKAQKPRWKKIMESVSGSLGDALGELYVKETFPPEAKERAKKIVNNLLAAMKERIQNVDWMSDTTKKKALEKLSAFNVKIGYPDKWKDFSKLEIKNDSYVENGIRAAHFEFQRDLAKIGKPVDKKEWHMTPQTVNAYYNPVRNEIVFPAAILQPPFFNQNADDAVNYGAMGAVIGHEITHGFDDRGRHYDAQGNLTDWWTKEDADKFNKRADVLVAEYNAFTPIDSMHINGRLTLGENIADLGGLTVSFTAFKKTDEYKKNKNIDGFTPSQRFFFSFAQVWKENIRDENLMLRLKTDPHSPAKERVIGPLSNMEPFWTAFDVKEGDPMRRPDSEVVKIW